MKETPPQGLQVAKEKSFHRKEISEQFDELEKKGANTIANALKALTAERLNRLDGFLNFKGETIYSLNIINEEDALSLINEYTSADEARLAEIEEEIVVMLS